MSTQVIIYYYKNQSLSKSILSWIVSILLMALFLLFSPQNKNNLTSFYASQNLANVWNTKWSESIFVDGANCWSCTAWCQWWRLVYVGKDHAVLKSALGKQTHNMFMWFWAHSIFALQGTVCVSESRGSVVWCGITGFPINTFLVLRYTENNKYSN